MATDHNDAVEFLRKASDIESFNRQVGLECLQFRYGEQWPQYAIASRGLDRPQLTINETNTYIKKVTNAQRQQRPRGRASPIDDFADKKVAKVITGIGRHIEVNSDADNAYDTAFDFAATIGWGYWRLRTDYIAEDSNKQDIYVDCIDNPFAVYFDWNSRLPDGSDAEGALITDVMDKEYFKKKYPGAVMASFNERGTGDADPDWITENDIRLAEYYYVSRQRAKLVTLTNGDTVWEDEIPHIKQLLMMAGIGVHDSRMSFKRTVHWVKQTGFEVLEEKTLPGKWIPIVPIYWTNVIINSRREKFGLVKDAIDPARMNNFWWTAMTESLALAPKAKFMGPEGFDEGHENEWRAANISAMPVLHFKTTGVDGEKIEPPERLQPEPPPEGLLTAGAMASANLSKVMGVFDPATRQGAQHKSDRTLDAERGQSENTNFDGYDNLTRSIKHSWRIMLSWIPSVFDTQRIQRIIGEDGREEMVTLNEKTQGQGESGEAIEKVLNDVCVGQYDVVMETGPAYDTKRQEGVNAMLQLMDTPLGEKIAAVADDVIVRQMDFPGADIIADRLAAANPMSQIDEKSEVPPQAQMMIKGLQQKLQQAGQQIQALEVEKKFGLQKESMRQEGETKRALMSETNQAHERLVNDATKRHDVETRALSAQNVEEIRGLVTLLAKKLDHAEAIRDFERDVNIQDRQLVAKSDSTETVQ